MAAIKLTGCDERTIFELYSNHLENLIKFKREPIYYTTIQKKNIGESSKISKERICIENNIDRFSNYLEL